MKNFIRLVLVLVTIVPLANCGSLGKSTNDAISMKLQSIQWNLVELYGTPVSPSDDGTRPFLKFDTEKKQATGFAGCNNFFGGYELNGAEIKFGPSGSTRRACPDLQEGLESDFFKALSETSAWNMKDGFLELLGDTRVLARFNNKR